MPRPSKGDRDALMTRPPLSVGKAVRAEAAARGMAVSDYVAAVLAREVGKADTFPLSPRRRERELPLADEAAEEGLRLTA